MSFEEAFLKHEIDSLPFGSSFFKKIDETHSLSMRVKYKGYIQSRPPSIIFYSSSLSKLFHHSHKPLEQVRRIVRAGGSFGMILNAEERQGLVPQPFERIVVEILVRQYDLAGFERVRIHREPMILRGNLHLLRLEIQHGMIPAVVSEFQFISFAAERQPNDLMS